MEIESSTKWIDRNRAPRVNITYDVEEGDAIRKVEIPFVVGVFADLSGDREVPLEEVRDRNFESVSMDTFDSFMKKQAPRVNFNVDNLLEGTGKMGVDLTFEGLEDFSPDVFAKKLGSEIEDIEVTEMTSDLDGKGLFKVKQDGPISKKIGTQISSLAVITNEYIATLLELRDPEDIDIQKVPNLADMARTRIRVTKKGPLAKLLQARERLSNLTRRADGKRAAEELLESILSDKTKQETLTRSAPVDDSAE